MQHVKVKYSEKPHLKEGTGWFSRWWYRRRVKHDNGNIITTISNAEPSRYVS